MDNMLDRLKSAGEADRIVATDSRQSLTTGMLAERCRQLADDLIDQDIRVLALHCDNCVDWVIVDIASQLASICLIPLPTYFSDDQLIHVFNSVPVDAIICQHPELFSSSIRNNYLQEFPTSLGGFQLLHLKSVTRDETLPAETSKVTFTSGSTGQPKGVCLSNGQMIMQALALARAVNLDAPRHLCVLPLSTLLENIAGIYAPLLAGGEVILPNLSEIGFEGSSSLDIPTFCDTIRRYRPDSIILTPQLLVALVTAAGSGWKPPETLKFVAVGGGRVSRNLMEQAHTFGIPAYEGYGLSECTSVVSINTAKHQKQSSCGRPLTHLNVEIEDGEIIVSGNAMLGYVGEPASWGKQRIYTGDLGSLDAEGYMFINGRKKNLLISSYGRNINPEWVESEVLSNPAIAECVLFGDSKPHCVALLSPRYSDESDEALQHIIDETNARLPDYARIGNWHRLPQPLYTEQNLVTENGRPRRKEIGSHYKYLIESLYSRESRIYEPMVENL